MNIQARVHEKAICNFCRHSYHDSGGFLRCVEMPGPDHKIPKHILTGDSGCDEFKRREK